MRRLATGLVMAVLGLMAASASHAAADTSAAAVQPLIDAGKIPCTLTASRYIGEGAATDKTKGKFYEIACKEGMGYVVMAHADGTPPGTFDCVTVSQPDANGNKSKSSCTLPANTISPIALFQPIITKIGEPCKVTKTRVIGSSKTDSYFELACDSGGGYILDLPRTAGADQPKAYDCLGQDPNGKVSCQLMNRDAFVTAQATKLIAASGKACALKDKRFVGVSSDSTGFYEVACQKGDGYMLEANPDGSFKLAVGCVEATGLLGGCTLTDTRAAMTAENAVYSDLAKKAGFDCAVTKYGPFAAAGPKEVVELQCSNRPDGGVGVFPVNGAAPAVYDCIRSQNQGYRCSFSSTDALYPKFTAQLVARGKHTCVVNGARPFGASDTNDFVEVSCADGGPGWVIQYPLTGQSPNDLLNCAQAANISPAGCQLPTNRKH